MAPSRGRLIFLIGLLVILTGLVIAQLVRYQVLLQIPSADAKPQLFQPEAVRRGWIYDRNGFVLAADEPRYMVLYDRNSGDPDRAARDLTPIIGLTPETFREAIGSGLVQTRLVRDLPSDAGKRVRALDIAGVTAQAYWKRIYPEVTLAAHLLGFVNEDRTGYYGLEGQYDGLLNGTALKSDIPGVRPGADLVLTLDRTAQAITEEELARGLQETGATSGSIIVMNPRNGEILAMASAPTFNPNQYADLAKTDINQFINPVTSSNFEPGSTFKIFTMAAALDMGLVTPETTYNDTTYIEIGGQVIWNWDRAAHGETDMVGLLAKSLNVGAASLAMQLGQQNFYRYVRAFGMGRPTGIDLQSEAAGQLRTRDTDPSNWSESDLGTNSFGQGVSATPIQMIAAVAAVANDGVLVQPHVVKKIVNGTRETVAKTVQVGRPISAKTAHTLTEMLVQVVEREVSFAQVPGYRVAGKTGTAQIPVPGGYDDPWTIASFIGYAPAGNPQLIIMVKLDRPTLSPYGSETAAPVFQKLATRLFAVLDIKPDDIQLAINNGQ
jgi:cell division protein FtsI/penicillin-binding protein 2